jgi:type I restriction enzyme S subunit
VPDEIPEANINQAIARYRPLNGVSNRFLSVAFQSKAVMGWAIRRAKTTAGQANLTLELCRELPIPLPPFAEQLRIVAEGERRLSVIEELETVVNANLQRTTRIRQAILQRVFTGEMFS